MPGFAQPPKPEPALDLATVLELYGVGAEQLRQFADDSPLSHTQRQLILRILAAWATGRNTAPDSGQPFDWAELASIPAAYRGKAGRLVGRVKQVRLLPLGHDDAERFGINRYYECRLELSDGRTILVVVPDVPAAWKIDNPLDEPITATGIFLKFLPDKIPLLVAGHLAWHPDNLLGRLGMDLALLDRVEQKRRLTRQDREAFYALLAAAGRATPDDLRGAALRGADVVKLFQEPRRYVGSLTEFSGTARRAVEIKVDDPDLERRYGFDHYYEVEVLLRVDNVAPELNPLVLVYCLRELPPEMAKGDDIRTPVSIPAFFFKLWTYQSQYATEAGQGFRQLAPLLIGPTALPRPLVRRDFYGTWVFLSGGVGSVILAGLVLWWFGRSDRRARQARASQRTFTAPPDFESPSLDELPS